MTTSTFSVVPRQSSDAEFRSWGSAISTALAAVGMTQTADTGQINWTTVTRAGANNTDAGFEIWRFNDAMQSTFPVFMRLGYGRSNNSDSNRLAISFGSGTNGSGTLTGVWLSSTDIGMISSGSSALDCYASGDGSGMFLSHCPSAATGQVRSMLMVDRPRGISNGTAAAGLFVAWKASTTTGVLGELIVNPDSTVAYSSAAESPTGLPTASASTIGLDNDMVGFDYAFSDGVVRGARMAAMGSLTDLALGASDLSMSLMGSSVTMRPLGTGARGVGNGDGMGANTAMAMYWQ